MTAFHSTMPTLCPEAYGVITGDFNICEPEEGRFNSWNQTFTDGDTGKAAFFDSLFPHVPDIAQLDFTGEGFDSR